MVTYGTLAKRMLKLTYSRESLSGLGRNACKGPILRPDSQEMTTLADKPRRWDWEGQQEMTEEGSGKRYFKC